MKTTYRFSTDDGRRSRDRSSALGSDGLGLVSARIYNDATQWLPLTTTRRRLSTQFHYQVHDYLGKPESIGLLMPAKKIPLLDDVWSCLGGFFGTDQERGPTQF